MSSLEHLGQLEYEAIFGVDDLSADALNTPARVEISRSSNTLTNTVRIF